MVPLAIACAAILETERTLCSSNLWSHHLSPGGEEWFRFTRTWLPVRAAIPNPVGNAADRMGVHRKDAVVKIQGGISEQDPL